MSIYMTDIYIYIYKVNILTNIYVYYIFYESKSIIIIYKY